MIQKLLRWFVVLIGILCGVAVANMVINNTWLLSLLHLTVTRVVEWITYIVIVILFGIIFYILFPLVLRAARYIATTIETGMEDVRLVDMIIGSIGLIIGLVIAMLISVALSQIPIPWISSVLSLLVYVVLGYVGFTISIRKRDELLALFHTNKQKDGNTPTKKLSKRKNLSQDKLLDTSVIIDGRIYDICKSGFLEGGLVIPVFVLKELQLIADSGDDLKRIRGRRGLDIIEKMQKELDGRIIISETEYDDIVGVDEKLMRMAKETKLKILTNDFNLNKVATVQGIGILNINELANAVKPVVLPGEEMKVLPVKNGKESGQAVAYLDDGTMIVVENGKRHIGDNISVTVTSILQTAAGRMIFAKPRH